MTNFRSNLALFGLLVSLPAASAQTITGTISGTVRDVSGAVLPNAQIQVVNQDTGDSRTLQTDATGHYAVLLLPLGNYQVTAAAQGFQTEVRNGIELTVGREAVVDMAMTIGAMTQKVEVTGEAATVNTTSATIEGLVEGEQIRELPLNGRSYNDLALLEPGVIYGILAKTSSADGFGARMSINGARANNNTFLMDGSVINDTSQTAGTVNEDSLGVEGIREFTVLTHNYGAEYGHNAGGIVNAVTRSGTNQLHGSLYEFIRNSDLDARDFFQPGGIAPFRRNQFGGSIGGKVIKDKLFYFGNYEGFRQSLSIPVAGFVPDAQAHQGIIPINGVETNVGLSPLIAPYMSLYPLPNGADTGTGTGLWTFNYVQPIVENYFMERVDYRISDKDSLYARDIYDNSTRPRNNSVPLWTVLDQATNYFAQIGETHIFTPNAFNDFRAAFNRTIRNTGLGPVSPLISSEITPAMSIVPGMPFGRIQPGGGMEYLGNLANDPAKNDQNLFEESDAFTLIHGKHSFKFGVDLERYQTIQISQANIRGSWLFGGIQSWDAAQPIMMDDAKVLGPTPFGDSVTEFGWRQWLPAWYVQDDWRVNSRLTLNLGLRQEFFTSPKEVNGLDAALINITDPASTIGSPFQTAKANFAPRIGVAWDPTGSGKTSVRFGVGTYFNEVNLREAGPPADYHFSTLYTLTCNWNPGAVNPCATFPYLPSNPPLSSAKSETAVQYHLPTPTTIQYAINIQRQLSNSTTIQAGYVGWYGYNLTATVNANDAQVDPATGLYNTAGALKPNPAFGTITDLQAIATANYNALQVEFRRRLAAGWSFQASYTFGKALADGDNTFNQISSNVGTAYVVTVPGDIGRDYGRSTYDQRNLIVINSQYELPFDRYLKGAFLKGVLGGWLINGIWSDGSGLPISIDDGFNRSGNGDPIFPDRPNISPGFSNNPVNGATTGCAGIPAGQPLQTPNRWFNPCAFSLNAAGTFGDLGRYTVNGPGYDNLNLSIGKTFPIRERLKLQLRVESFNILNHPQFGTPGLAIFTSNGSYNGTAGAITQTSNPGLGGRNVQFGLKMTF